jgi:hypothetical protein
MPADQPRTRTVGCKMTETWGQTGRSHDSWETRHKRFGDGLGGQTGPRGTDGMFPLLHSNR